MSNEGNTNERKDDTSVMSNFQPTPLLYLFPYWTYGTSHDSGYGPSYYYLISRRACTVCNANRVLTYVRTSAYMRARARACGMRHVPLT